MSIVDRDIIENGNNAKLTVTFRKASASLGVPVEMLYDYFMLERFLERVSLSPFKDNFVLKGGLLVTNIIGIQNRSTRDVDGMIRGIQMEEKQIVDMVKEIINVPVPDHVTFEISKTAPIRPDDDYGGFRIKLVASRYELRAYLHIDISTGEDAYPHPIKTKYNVSFGGGTIDILSYNIESILAEKIETSLARSTAGTRMRDYYDIYSIYKLKRLEINTTILKEAIVYTADRRNTGFILTDYTEILDDIRSEPIMESHWENYKSTFTYAKGIKFSDTVDTIRLILEQLSF